MSVRNRQYMTSLLVSAFIVGNPMVAQAAGMSHIGAYGSGSSVSVSRECKQLRVGGSFRISNNTQAYNSMNNTNNINVYKPTTINNNLNVYQPVSVNNNINIYKPVTIDNNVDITNNINASKDIAINKPISINTTIDNSKNIDASKNIEINKSVVINKGVNISQSSSKSESISVAAAIAEAGANSGATTSSSSFSGGGGIVLDTPISFAGGDIGSISAESAATSAATPQQCTFVDTTIVKAIHAVCVSADNHEFPASHMVPDTWINSGYEGEIARCIPGAHLKVTVGKVVQSSEGLATGYSSGQVLECAAHEAVRHYKDGMLKCVPAESVPDCTERTNLRKIWYGRHVFHLSREDMPANSRRIRRQCRQSEEFLLNDFETTRPRTADQGDLATGDRGRKRFYLLHRVTLFLVLRIESGPWNCLEFQTAAPKKAICAQADKWLYASATRRPAERVERPDAITCGSESQKIVGLLVDVLPSRAPCSIWEWA